MRVLFLIRCAMVVPILVTGACAALIALAFLYLAAAAFVGAWV